MTIRTILLTAFTALTCVNIGATAKMPFPGGKCTLYRVTLTDKKGTPYTIANPDKYLSHKAIERRAKQNIEVDSTDLPINPDYIAEIGRAHV